MDMDAMDGQNPHNLQAAILSDRKHRYQNYIKTYTLKTAFEVRLMNLAAAFWRLWSYHELKASQ